jgi:hypothetical protein
MGVAINQPRRQQPAAKINAPPGRGIVFRHNGFNPAIAHQQRMTIPQAVRLRIIRVQSGEAGISPDNAIGGGFSHTSQLVMGCIDIYFHSTRNVNKSRGNCYFFVTGRDKDSAICPVQANFFAQRLPVSLNLV